MSDFPPNVSIRPLTIEDIDQCIELEKKGFPENERCTPAKFKYRLTVAPELCSGLFIRDYDYKYNYINLPEVAKSLQEKHDAEEKRDPSKTKHGEHGEPDDDDDDDDDEEFPEKSSVVKETLIGHIIATKVDGTRITEASMELPSKDVKGSGHCESSRYIGIHSVVIAPEWRGKNLAALLLHDYIQKLSNQDMGDQVVLIAHKELIPFYEKIGFNNVGESECKFANTTWYDMAIDLVPADDL
ncbi:hypothetical protein KGF57_001228 [Candida theae]|uniref:N-acetyltransferase domain-containing protein n=1 Tax=Candida theae TaxID=1198502 RepID=A0AAD5BHX8_9ASCO|nr:uncharacterized protein KGF57_001228 [Candida theae]KAI5963852.1 hypothetical protein KGF57_001228 [Candida theae]